MPTPHRHPLDDAAYVRLPEVKRRTGLSRSTIYREIAAERFPRPCRLSPHAVGWPKSDIDAWCASRARIDA